MKSNQPPTRRVRVPDRMIDGMLAGAEIARRVDGWVAGRIGLGATIKDFESGRKSHFRAGSWVSSVVAGAATFVASDFVLSAARAPQQVHSQVRYLPMTHHAVALAGIFAGITAAAVKFGPAIDRVLARRRVARYHAFLERGHVQEWAIRSVAQHRSQAHRLDTYIQQEMDYRRASGRPGRDVSR